MTEIINNFSKIIDKYDFFILDQWGVMHDGHKGYQHAINAEIGRASCRERV